MPVNEKTALFSANTKKFLVSKEYCIAYHDAEMWFFANADIIFFWWLTLNNFHRNWTHCVSDISTWIDSIHSSSIDLVERLLSRAVKRLIMTKEQSILIKVREVDRMPSIVKKILEEKYRNHFWAPSKKQNQCKSANRSSQEIFLKLKMENTNRNKKL